MHTHLAFELLAWLSALGVSSWVSRRGWLNGALKFSLARQPGYFVALAFGAVAGGTAAGSLNLRLLQGTGFGHSLAGAIAGAIVSVELYKAVFGVHGSTGVRFVAPLATGITVGRWGCFSSGLQDGTHGRETGSSFGYDFGDGVLRHPVQIYESAAMLLFLTVFLVAVARRSETFRRKGFYLFVAWYAGQRFVWEFLKPYPGVVGPLNVFHLICGALALYAVAMLNKAPGIDHVGQGAAA